MFFFLGTLSIFGQHKNINNYKYIIVNSKVDFLKETDEYQTSSLTKFLLKKNGYTVFLDNEELPSEIIKNRCLALTANLVSSSSLFLTKISIVLKDCFGKELYSSEEGKSKSKEYKKSYQEAIRNAHTTMDLKYSYQPKEEQQTLVEEVKTRISIPAKIINDVKEVLPVKIENFTNNNGLITKVNTLYAQPKENGYQLINTKPEVIFSVLKTKTKDLFIIKDKNGILYKNSDSWIAEYYKNNKLVREKYKIKF